MPEISQLTLALLDGPASFLPAFVEDLQFSINGTAFASRSYAEVSV